MALLDTISRRVGSLVAGTMVGVAGSDGFVNAPGDLALIALAISAVVVEVIISRRAERKARREGLQNETKD